jgi:hypothetical protein
MSWQTVVLILGGGFLLLGVVWLVVVAVAAKKVHDATEKSFEDFHKKFDSPFKK